MISVFGGRKRAVMMHGKSKAVVKTGTYLYAGEVVCDLQVVYSAVRYGSGDSEDPADVANDQSRASYYLEYGSTTERGAFSAGGGGFDSLEQAMQHAEKMVQGVRWR